MSASSSAPGGQHQRFAAYLDSLAQAAGHLDRAVPLESYCTGLLLPGERKSVEPMAARLAPDDVQRTHQSLHHFEPHPLRQNLDGGSSPCYIYPAIRNPQPPSSLLPGGTRGCYSALRSDPPSPYLAKGKWPGIRYSAQRNSYAEGSGSGSKSERTAEVSAR
jgi:hypothetical protein